MEDYEQLKDDMEYLGQSSDISQERLENIARALDKFLNKLVAIIQPVIEWIQENAVRIIEPFLAWAKAVRQAGLIKPRPARFRRLGHQVWFARPAFHRLN